MDEIKITYPRGWKIKFEPKPVVHGHSEKPAVESKGSEYNMTSNRQLLEDLDYDNLVVFENPDYDSAIIGVSHDDRVIYDYDKMIQYLMDEEHMDIDEAADFISYNTIRSIGYVGPEAPIVMYGLN